MDMITARIPRALHKKISTYAKENDMKIYEVYAKVLELGWNQLEEKEEVEITEDLASKGESSSESKIPEEAGVLTELKDYLEKNRQRIEEVSEEVQDLKEEKPPTSRHPKVPGEEDFDTFEEVEEIQEEEETEDFQEKESTETKESKEIQEQENKTVEEPPQIKEKTGDEVQVEEVSETKGTDKIQEEEIKERIQEEELAETEETEDEKPAKKEETEPVEEEKEEVKPEEDISAKIDRLIDETKQTEGFQYDNFDVIAKNAVDFLREEKKAAKGDFIESVYDEDLPEDSWWKLIRKTLTHIEEETDLLSTPSGRGQIYYRWNKTAEETPEEKKDFPPEIYKIIEETRDEENIEYENFERIVEDGLSLLREKGLATKKDFIENAYDGDVSKGWWWKLVRTAFRHIEEKSDLVKTPSGVGQNNYLWVEHGKKERPYMDFNKLPDEVLDVAGGVEKNLFTEVSKEFKRDTLRCARFLYEVKEAKKTDFIEEIHDFREESKATFWEHGKNGLKFLGDKTDFIDIPGRGQNKYRWIDPVDVDGRSLADDFSPEIEEIVDQFREKEGFTAKNLNSIIHKTLLYLKDVGQTKKGGFIGNVYEGELSKSWWWNMLRSAMKHIEEETGLVKTPKHGRMKYEWVGEERGESEEDEDKEQGE